MTKEHKLNEVTTSKHYFSNKIFDSLSGLIQELVERKNVVPLEIPFFIDDNFIIRKQEPILNNTDIEKKIVTFQIFLKDKNLLNEDIVDFAKCDTKEWEEMEKHPYSIMLLIPFVFLNIDSPREFRFYKDLIKLLDYSSENVNDSAKKNTYLMKTLRTVYNGKSRLLADKRIERIKNYFNMNSVDLNPKNVVALSQAVHRYDYFIEDLKNRKKK